MGFVRLKSRAVAANKATGNAVMEVIATVGQPNSAWSLFKADPKKWLFDNGYEFFDATTGRAIGGGRVPASLELVVVEDTATKMHVRLPFHGDLDANFVPRNDSYGGKYPVFMARYFMRKCR
jgi:hypothetical protein